MTFYKYARTLGIQSIYNINIIVQKNGNKDYLSRTDVSFSLYDRFLFKSISNTIKISSEYLHGLRHQLLGEYRRPVPTKRQQLRP